MGSTPSSAFGPSEDATIPSAFDEAGQAVMSPIGLQHPTIC